MSSRFGREKEEWKRTRAIDKLSGGVVNLAPSAAALRRMRAGGVAAGDGVAPPEMVALRERRYAGIGDLRGEKRGRRRSHAEDTRFSIDTDAFTSFDHKPARLDRVGSVDG
ncbi:uncharacterized protein A4U43_C07F36370 [Asparagus officinalis]|uniref:Uncharacterized protein n=1 Tax=Asparagus officinalis TaxID=4686 RepID=A0A5P1EHJ7_ASPOF|nr:uncharacterized protein A4U43_C07F36370 [Asparagus officinalis]